MSAVGDEDKLDARQARQVMRRAGRMLGPYRRTFRLAMGLVVIYTLTTLAGPYLLKFGIDKGIKRHDAGALNGAVMAYVVIAIVAYVVNRTQVLLVSRVGEGFLRDMRVRVFDHLQRLSMPFYDREKAGVIVSRMTSDVDSLQELVQFGLLQFVSSALLIVLSVLVLALVSWQLLLICLIPRVGGVGQHQVPARFQPGVPHRAGPHRAHPVGAPGGHQRGTGHPGLRARRRRGGTLRPAQPHVVRRSMRSGGCRPGTCRSSSSPPSAPPRW
ncbi:MAG: ABC transporter transmembrane domain-containing protein [Acidimicrobiales bacterium]